jgi:hypothetical protein
VLIADAPLDEESGNASVKSLDDRRIYELWPPATISNQKSRYHAVPHNLRALSRFRDRLCLMWRAMLGRRSQRSRPSWTRIRPTFERWIPRARVLHPYPDVRFDVTHPR